MESRAWLFVLSLVWLGSSGDTAWAKTYETRDAALLRVFGPAARIERHTLFLTQAQLDSARALGSCRIEHLRLSYYEATRGDTLVGRAYLDTHRVRNEYETLLIVVDPDGQTREVDVLAFHEPEDYLVPRGWLETLQGRALSSRLRPGDAVDAISGATLSTRAASEAVRRVLALDRVVHGGNP